MNEKTLSIIIKAQDQTSATLDRISKNTERTADVARTSWLKAGAVFGAVAGIITNVTSRAISGLSAVVGDAVSRIDTMNNFPRIMQNFGVNTHDATKMIKDLDLGVRGLPTTLNSIAILAEGFVPLTKNTDMATKTALALNNAILAGGTPIQVQSAALEQFRQALAKGVPDLQDWKSLETAMPAQLQQVNDKLGIGKGKLKDYTNTGLGLYQAMKDGKLKMSDFNDALISLNSEGINGLPSFAIQAKNATQGIATGMTNAKTAVVRGLADIMQAVGTSNISFAFSTIGRSIESIFKTFAIWIPIIKQDIKDIGERVGAYLAPKFDALWLTISTRLIPAIDILWHKYIEPLIPVLGVMLVVAIGASITALNLIISSFMWLVNTIASGNPVMIGLIALFGSLAAVMAFNAIFNALTVGFATLQLITIPSVMASITSLRALIMTPTVLGAIGVGAALAAILLVQNALDRYSQSMQKTFDQTERASASVNSAVNQMQSLAKNGTPEQQARARASLKRYNDTGSFASGGYTGAGGTNEVAGVVHKGEYVVPQSAVNQETGMPKGMGGVFNMYGNITLGSADAVDGFFTRINAQKEMGAMGVGV